MRKKFPLILPIILTLSLVAAPSFASVKAGATCTKAGATATAAGKKFTCIKSGKRLVWNKGVTIKAAPKPNLNPVLKPVEPTPAPTSVPEPKKLSPLEKLNQDIYQRYLAADKNLSPVFNFVRCPNANPAMSEVTQKAYIDAYSFWAPIYKGKSQVNWLLMSEKDWDCWYETTEKFEGPNSVSRSWNVWNKSTGVMGHCNVGPDVFCGYGTGVQQGGIFAQYNLFGSNFKTAPTPLTVHHEAVHIYQAQVIADNFPTSKARTVACWFMEGQANLIGVPIASEGNTNRQRNLEILRLSNAYPSNAAYTKERWLEVLNELDKPDQSFCFDNGLGYSLGWLALEWTYMNYSIEEMHTFLELIAKGSTWDQAIQAVMKMDKQSYYSKIAQYLADEL